VFFLRALRLSKTRGLSFVQFQAWMCSGLLATGVGIKIFVLHAMDGIHLKVRVDWFRAAQMPATCMCKVPGLPPLGLKTCSALALVGFQDALVLCIGVGVSCLFIYGIRATHAKGFESTLGGYSGHSDRPLAWLGRAIGVIAVFVVPIGVDNHTLGTLGCASCVAAILLFLVVWDLVTRELLPGNDDKRPVWELELHEGEGHHSHGAHGAHGDDDTSSGAAAGGTAAVLPPVPEGDARSGDADAAAVDKAATAADAAVEAEAVAEAGVSSPGTAPTQETSPSEGAAARGDSGTGSGGVGADGKEDGGVVSTSVAVDFDGDEASAPVNEEALPPRRQRASNADLLLSEYTRLHNRLAAIRVRFSLVCPVCVVLCAVCRARVCESNVLQRRVTCGVMLWYGRSNSRLLCWLTSPVVGLVATSNWALVVVMMMTMTWERQRMWSGCSSGHTLHLCATQSHGAGGHAVAATT